MLTRKELLEAYWDYGFKFMSEVEVDKILAIVDNDGNGYVTFTEFLTASVCPDDVLTGQKLLSAFKKFDADGSGAITVDEIKEVIGADRDIPDTQWEELLSEVDDDGNAEITLEEFCDMMRNVFKHM